MRHWVVLAGTALLLLAPSALAAEAQGELTSDAPVALFGDGKAIGQGLHLYHHAFRDASLNGKVYSGAVTEHAVLGLPPSAAPQAGCFELEGRKETNSGPVADPNQIYTMIEYELRRGAFARIGFPGDARFSVGETGETPEDQPFLYLGPNPYPTTGEETPEEGADAQFVQAFATHTFVAVPVGAFSTVGPLNLELHWGEMKTLHRDRERVHKAGVFEETRPNPNPSPIGPAEDCRVIATRWVTFDQIVVVASVDQEGTERVTDYWADAGRSSAEAGELPDGSWPRAEGAEYGSELERRSLPATLVSGPDFHVALAGRAQFEHALGSVSIGGRLEEARDVAFSLTGRLDLQPVAQEGGHRMTTQIRGDAATVAVAAPKGPGLTWTLDVPATLGFAGAFAALGAAAWAWPVLKFKGTQWLLFPLYARLKKEDVLENPLRDDILEVVQRSPGISASELGRRLECGWGTLVYHLTVLERMQLLSSAREGRHKRFFVQGRINYSDKAAVGLLANASARTILDAVKERPGLIQRDLGRLLGLSPGTVAWHIDRLEEAGLILKEEEGRVVRYYPSAKLIELTRQLAA